MWRREIALPLAVTLSGLTIGGCAPYELGINTIQDPVPNANPSSAIRISGPKSETLSLEFRVLYSTANEYCKKPVNLLMGAYAPGAHGINYPVKQSATEYEVTMFLDAVLPGDCEWRPHSILYTVAKEGKRMMVPVPPTPLFWITKDGRFKFPAFEVECEISAWQGQQETGLWCNRPRGNYVLAPTATDVRVAFIERQWRGTKPKRLPE
jgi:hypothetical protein